MAKKKKELPEKVSLLKYANEYNPKLTRRGKRMTFSYLYRIIRENEAGKNIDGGKPRELWFNYVKEGEKEHIMVILD
jgi:hypothetical protein